MAQELLEGKPLPSVAIQRAILGWTPETLAHSIPQDIMESSRQSSGVLRDPNELGKASSSSQESSDVQAQKDPAAKGKARRQRIAWRTDRWFAGRER